MSSLCPLKIQTSSKPSTLWQPFPSDIGRKWPSLLESSQTKHSGVLSVVMPGYLDVSPMLRIRILEPAFWILVKYLIWLLIFYDCVSLSVVTIGFILSTIYAFIYCQLICLFMCQVYHAVDSFWNWTELNNSNILQKCCFKLLWPSSCK